MDSDESDGYATEKEQTSTKRTKSTKKYSKKKKLTESMLTATEFKDGQGQGKCTICKSVLKGGKSELLRHRQTKSHLRAERDKAGQDNMNINKFIPLQQKITRTENSICSFIVEQNLPISLVELLTKLIKSLPDATTLSKLQLGRQKATNVIRQGLRPYFNTLLVNELSSNYYSVYENNHLKLTVTLKYMYWYFEAF